MRRPKSQRAFAQSIAFAVLSSGLFLNVFGQNAPGSQCAAEDYECYVRGYTAAIKANPNNAAYYESRGASYVKLKRFDEALQDYSTVINLNPKSNLGYIGRGYVYQLQGRYVEAVIEFNKAIKIDPKDSYALDLHRYCLALIGKGPSAVEDYGKLIEFDPNNAEYYHSRAEKYFQFKDFVRAVEDASKAIELNPKYAEAYAVRSDSYCRLGKPKESNVDVARYEALTGKKTGAVCKFCDDTPIDCAIRTLTEKIALEMKKEIPQQLNYLYRERGILYYNKGDYGSALADFNKTEDKEGNVSASAYRGDIYLRKGEYDAALFDFKQFLKSSPASAKTNLQVGQIYLTKGDFDSAFKYFDTVIFLNSGDSEARLGRAAVYLQRAEKYSETGKDEIKTVEAYENAVEDFSEAIRNDKKINPRVYLKRADVYEKIGETEKAENDRAKYQELSAKP